MKPGIKKPIIIFLGTVFVVSTIIIVTRGIQFPQITYLNQKKPTAQPPQPKMTDLKVQNNKIILKYSELDLMMTECCSTVVKEVKSEKEGNSVKIKGKATFPFSAAFEGNLTPYVENKKVKVKLTNLVLGKIESPQMLSDKLTDLINLGFEQKINSIYKVKDVKIGGDGIEITIN